MNGVRKTLTISMAAYNAEDCIRDALDSIFECDDIKNKVQVIIVNDGSTDGTQCIAEEYASRYRESITLVNKKNQGFGATINDGIKHAVGDYFMLLDADDCLMTDNISRLIGVLEECKTDLIVAPYIIKYICGDKELFVDNHRYIPTMAVSIDSIAEFRPLIMHELIIKTSVLKEKKIEVGNGFYTDSELVFKAILHCFTIQRFMSPMYIYRMGRPGQSVSLEGTRRHLKDKLDLADRMIKEYLREFKCIKCEALLNLIERELANNIGGVYSTYMIQIPLGICKDKLMEYDEHIKDIDERIYLISGRVKKIHILRVLHFALYRMVCFFELKKLEKIGKE